VKVDEATHLKKALEYRIRLFSNLSHFHVEALKETPVRAEDLCSRYIPVFVIVGIWYMYI
jgi:hypothetical protein